MLRMRKGLVAAVAGLALLATACGGNAAKKAEAGTPTKKDPTKIAASLTWWDTSDPKNEGPAFQELITKFNQKYPNIKINYQSVPFGDAQNKFKTAAAAKSGAPDILRAEVAWVPEFASLGYLYQLDGTDLTKDQSDFLPAPLGSTKFGGKSYGVPQVTDSLGLMYNKKLFAKAGIAAPPKTWAEVKTDAAALKSKAGVDGIYVNAAGYFLLPFIYGEGGDLIDPQAKKITVADPAAVKGVQIAQDLVKSGAATKPSAQDSYGTMMTLFKEQKVGMIINGPWEVNNIRTAPTFGGIENLGVAPVPAGSAKAGAPVGGHDYVIWSGMPQAKAEAAIAFIGFMSSADSEAFIAQKLGLLPPRKSAYDLDAVKSNAVIAAFQPVMQSAVERPWIPEGGQLFGPLDDMATKVLVEGQAPDAALKTVASKYKSEVLKDYS